MQHTLRRSYRYAAPPAFADEGADLTSLAFFYRDDTDVVPLPQRNYVAQQDRPWLPRPSLDEGIDTTRLAYFEREENDIWLEGQRWVQAQPWAAVTFPEREGLDATQLAYFYRDDTDQWWQQELLAQARPWLPVVVADDETFPLPPALPVEEEYWVRPATQLVPTSLFVQLDEAELAGFAYFYLDQEEPTLTPVQAVPRPYPAALDDEASSFAYLEQEDQPPTPREAQPWQAVVFLYEDPSWPLAYFYLEDERPAYPAVPAGPWAARVFLDDDLYPTPPPTTAVEQEDGYPLTQQARPWLPLTFPDEGADATALAYLPVDQDDWRAPAVPAPPWAARALADDEGVPVRLEPEDLAVGPPARQAPVARPPLATTGDEELIPAYLEDDRWGPSPAALWWPAPARLAPADDDRPTPPVPLFVDDEAGPWATSSLAAQVRPWLRFAVEDEHGLGFVGTGLGNTGVVVGGAYRRQVIVARG